MIGKFFGAAFYLLFYLAPWLLLFSLILLGWGLWQRKRSISLVGASLALMGLASILIPLYRAGLGVDAAVTLVRAYATGYEYEPPTESPDPALMVSRPDVIIQRQLDALVGQTGPAPLRSDTALVGYELGQVRVCGWLSEYPVAHVTAKLKFANGSQQSKQFVLVGGGSILLLPWFGETTWQITGWRGSPLAKLLKEPVPATSLGMTQPPIELHPIASVDAGALEQEVGSVDIAVPSDIANDGRLLFDQDVRTKEGSCILNRLILRHPSGELERLAQTYISTRGKFSSNGKHIAYVRSQQGESLHLVVRDAGGDVKEIGMVNWMTHHWVDDDQVAYSANGQVQLYSLADGTQKSLASLSPESLVRSRYFRVAPGGQHLAYSDTDGRLWLLAVDSGVVRPFGWDVSELSWGSGMAWDAPGERLAYSAFNRTTLPDQAEVWVRHAESDAATLLARSGPGFLGDSNVNFGKVCWADDRTVLFAAHRLNRSDVRLLAAAADASGLWDVTPAGLAIPFPELTCAGGYIAVPTQRTRLELLKIVSTAYTSATELGGRSWLQIRRVGECSAPAGSGHAGGALERHADHVAFRGLLQRLHVGVWFFLPSVRLTLPEWITGNTPEARIKAYVKAVLRDDEEIALATNEESTQ